MEVGAVSVTKKGVSLCRGSDADTNGSLIDSLTNFETSISFRNGAKWRESDYDLAKRKLDPNTMSNDI